MALIPWKSFSDLDNFFEDDNFFLPVFSKGKISEPAMDVYEKKNEIIVELDAPGFNPEKIDVSVKNGVLIVKGEMEEEKEDKEKNYWRKESRKSSFERMIRLPMDVDEDKVEADYDKGVLKIIMPKAKNEKSLKKKIKVKSKSK
ncbi:Hsp20/alpha crystallin family protein [Candidatus Wolfebacteria bacterium]|nr:Hsp20/alpha crystallin family protein [Candidatus Wolfebacteria bacterium]